MAELNKMLLIGRLTRDVELRFTSGGTAVAELALASNHSYGKGDEKKQETCYIDVTVFGRSAEIANEYLAKGSEIFVEGRLRLDQWENKEGEKRRKHVLVADRFQFLSGKGDETDGASNGTATAGAASSSGGSAATPSADDDELPF